MTYRVSIIASYVTVNFDFFDPEQAVAFMATAAKHLSDDNERDAEIGLKIIKEEETCSE